MNNKPKQGWGEIQLAIAAVGLTATLVFWNLFSTPQKQKDVAQAGDTQIPPSQDTTQADATPTPAFYPVKIIFGGTAPAPQATNANVVFQPPAPQPKRRGGGGGGGGGGGTGSSKPK
ncbi:MAG: hypothetical protein WA821_13400 [Anaerolineales bacterium]